MDPNMNEVIADMVTKSLKRMTVKERARYVGYAGAFCSIRQHKDNPTMFDCDLKDSRLLPQGPLKQILSKFDKDVLPILLCMTTEDDTFKVSCLQIKRESVKSKVNAKDLFMKLD